MLLPLLYYDSNKSDYMNNTLTNNRNNSNPCRPSSC